MVDTDEERLLVEAAQQDPSRFGELYERHVHRVYAFVLARVRDRHVAEDLTADVFHKALAGLRSFEWRGVPFGAWLIRIAANCVVDQHREAARNTPAADNAAAVDGDGLQAPGALQALQALEAVQAPDALHALERFEDRARLFRYVDELPDVQRTVIIERFAHERSLREVAAIVGKTEGAIKQIQLRALRALRVRMEGGHA